MNRAFYFTNIYIYTYIYIYIIKLFKITSFQIQILCVVPKNGENTFTKNVEADRSVAFEEPHLLLRDDRESHV
jgi:hypothetical protein